jgi:hypothetical protein
MARTEELTTKLRTLSYDHERLMSIHRTAMERAANAEREMNVHKSRLTYIYSSIGLFPTDATATKVQPHERYRPRKQLIDIPWLNYSALEQHY